ncbi:NAD/NADP octopine/nopaline dehydrogenase family protein [Neobittarella massiliensis]|uniref:NAD/NADP octopine/nopaline dehydrogenase family protein n=1 Tax=Neobittarella massiliensis (ex Bilen et al. 2018) TaxID=2041842 RepID=A0A8J6IRB3_9FIRM|nr:NAD/NADP octopine/nopaline dehydrogenase family protein [Neobittarella massiliensis]
MKISVIGGGNGGTAFTGYLIHNGHQVSMYTRNPEKVAFFNREPDIYLSGVVNASVKAGLVTHDLGQALAGSELIMIASSADAHRHLARQMAPYLKDGQVVVLNPGRTFGSYEFANILAESGCTADVTIGETDTLIFTCRNHEINHPIIYSIKKDVKFACLKPERTQRTVELLQQLFPTVQAVPSILYTGLTNIGMIFHPTPILFNFTRIESGQTFLFYKEAITPMVASFISHIDEERVAVARRMGVEVETAMQWLLRVYGASGDTLYDAIQNNPAYNDVYAPKSTDTRYVWEDVPTGLVPIASVGDLIDVDTPYIDTAINLACMLYNVDFKGTGRQITSLDGIHGEPVLLRQ